MSSKQIKQKKELTPTEYAQLTGVTVQAVTKAIRASRALKGISEVRNYGRFYILIVGDWKEIVK